MKQLIEAIVAFVIGVAIMLCELLVPGIYYLPIFALGIVLSFLGLGSIAY